MDMAPVYFWKQEEEPYGVFCQWYPSKFVHEGITYHSCEMWMMIAKARTFEDEASLQEMLRNAKDPRKLKSLGQKVKGFDNETWDNVKFQIVEEGNWLKFTQSTEKDAFAELLLSTGDRELVEASRFDRIWGIGFTAKDAAASRAAWGENLLGKALMNVRSRLKAEMEAKEGK